MSRQIPLSRPYLAALVAAACCLTAGHAVAQSTHSPWTRVTNDQRQYAAQPGRALPLSVTNASAFEAGSYDLHFGVTDGSDRCAPIGYSGSVPVRLQENTRYFARADSSGNVSFTMATAALDAYPAPGPGRAMVYVRNEDPQRWHAVCLLPSGWPLAQCRNPGC